MPIDKLLTKRISDDYEIVQQIGNGAFGTVWLVKYKPSGEYKAIKIQKVSQSSKDEVVYLIKFDHANIVRIYDYFFAQVDDKTNQQYFSQ